VADRLATRGLTVAFGAVCAVDAVDIHMAAGQIVGLIGPNGAGKTTLIDAVTGHVVATAGRVELNGRDITALPAHRRARLGLARTWQTAELFDDLTIADNLRVACEQSSGRALLRRLGPSAEGRSSSEERARRALEHLDLLALSEHMPSELTHGQRKLAGIARAMVTNPTVVCLDEPAAGLDTAETRHLADRLRAAVSSSVSMLLVDHDMGLVLDVCHHVYVIDFGRLIAMGTPAEVREDRRVIRAYLGEDDLR
jgi:branched-chain amino acid transport system ATP-binding protein